MKPLLTPQEAELQKAFAEIDRAREACAHWDYNGDYTDDPYECCHQVLEARRALRLVRLKIEEAGAQ